MQGADPHLRETKRVHTFVFEDRENALFELGRRLVCEGECDDVSRLNPWLPKDRSDALRDDLGLAGPGTRDDLERLVDTGDRLGLSLGIGGHLVEGPEKTDSSPLEKDINRPRTPS